MQKLVAPFTARLQKLYLAGNPKKLYPQLPASSYNDMLYQLHQCFMKWIKKIEIVGWQEANKQKLSPFDDCNCRMEFVLPPK